MHNVDGNWTLNTADVPTDVPTGNRFFRAIASVPGYLDGTSSAEGPENVLDGIAPLTTVADPGRDIADWMRESRARIETAKRCDALALVRADGDEGSCYSLPLTVELGVPAFFLHVK